MVSNMKRHKNIIALMTKKVEKGIIYGHDKTIEPYASSRGNNSFYYFPFCFSLCISLEKSIKVMEDKKGVVYFGVDANNFRVRLHRSYNQNKNPADEAEVEALDVMYIFARDHLNTDPAREPLPELLPKLAPYSLQSIKDNPELVKRTAFWKELLGAVQNIQDNISVRVNAKPGSWPTLDSLPALPVAWVSFEKGTFTWYTTRWGDSYRKGTKTIPIEEFISSSSNLSMYLPLDVASVYVKCPYYQGEFAIL